MRVNGCTSRKQLPDRSTLFLANLWVQRTTDTPSLTAAAAHFCLCKRLPRRRAAESLGGDQLIIHGPFGCEQKIKARHQSGITSRGVTCKSERDALQSERCRCGDQSGCFLREAVRPCAVRLAPLPFNAAENGDFELF